jgi:hypothetical protein
MQKEARKEPRLDIVGLKVEGILKPTPASEGAQVLFNDISPAGALITVTGPMGEDMKQTIVDLVKASKKGSFIPVQLVLNNVRIPVNLVALVGQDKFAVRISDNEKLAALAEKGKIIFNDLYQAAVKKGAPEARLTKHQILGREFLPEGIRRFVEAAAFGPLFTSELAKELATALPILKDKVEDAGEYTKLAGLCEKFLVSVGRDVILLVGAEMAALQEWGDRLDELLTRAVQKICSDGRLFSGDKERAAFEDILVRRYFKKPPPANFSDLPKDSPLIYLIDTRFANFDHTSNFFLTLPPFLSDFYFNIYLPRESEIVKMFDWDKKGLKDTLYRWVHSALNQMSIDTDRTVATEMEGRFKQAMYEFIQAKKAVTITPADISRIIDGTKLPPGYVFRDKFFRYACGVVDAQVRKRFEKYKEEINKAAYVHEDPHLVEARKIAQTNPLDLMLHNLWVKVPGWGLTASLNKEVAKTFVPKEKAVGILEFGGMVVFDQRGFDGFQNILPQSFDEEQILDFFDIVDFKKLYQMGADPEVKKKDAVVWLYIQSIKPPALRDAIIERVINSPQRCRYYVLRKPKSYFEKNVGDEGGDWLSFIEEHMLTTNPEVHNP